MSLARAAEETLAVIARGSYVAPSGAEVPLREQIDAAVRGTVVYRPDELEALVASLPRATPSSPRIELTAETTAEAGRRLVQTERTAHVVALNFASARKPSGGVPFFRDERLRFLEAPFLLSIITAPAPNAGEALVRDPRLGPQIERLLATRAEKLLAIAATRRHRCLVLGAWGCGVFRNDPAAVANAFALALADQRFGGAFDRVVFAVYDPGGRNLGAFERRFGLARL